MEVSKTRLQFWNWLCAQRWWQNDGCANGSVNHLPVYLPSCRRIIFQQHNAKLFKVYIRSPHYLKHIIKNVKTVPNFYPFHNVYQRSGYR